MGTPQKLTKEAVIGNFLPIVESGASLKEAYNQFSKEKLEMPDRVTLEKNIKTTNRPKHLWYNTVIRNQCKIIRNREKIWRRCRQDHQWKAYKIERDIYNHLFTYNKKQEITCQSSQEKKTQKNFKIVNNVTSKKQDNPMPDEKSDDTLAEEFADYFLEKM